MTYSEWVRFRTCDRKHGWSTEALALNFCILRGWADPSALPLHPYRCAFCGDWHTTSKPLLLVEGGRQVEADVLDVEIPKDVVA